MWQASITSCKFELKLTKPKDLFNPKYRKTIYAALNWSTLDFGLKFFVGYKCNERY